MRENTTLLTSTVTLPSEGKVYKEAIDSQVTLRGMTTADEIKRLSVTDRAYEKLCEVIDDCIIEGPHISSYDMCMGDYRFLLFNLRNLTYGPNYHITSKCPYCGMQNNETIDISQLNILRYKEDTVEKLRNLKLPVSGNEIKLKMMTPRMQDDILEKVKEFKRKANTDQTLTYSIAYRIDQIDGRTPERLFLDEWVKKLPMKDVNTICQYADKLDETIGVDVETLITCNLCGLGYDAYIRTDSEFFRPTLDI